MDRKKSVDARLARFFLHLDISETSHRNAWLLVVEIFWAAFYNATALFTAAYALRLGADNYQVGLLSSLPALVAIFVSIPAGRFLQSRPQIKYWVIGTLSLFRFSYFLIALIPWLPPITVLTPGAMVVAILVLFSVPLHFFNVGWFPLLAEVLEEDLRPAIFSVRSMVYNATLSISVFGFGLWLNVLPLPLNYQIMYLVGYFTTFLSVYNLVKLQVRTSPGGIQKVLAKESLYRRVQGFLHDLNKNIEFMRLTRNTLFLYLGIWAVTPLYVLYFVRELHVSDGWLGLYNAIAAVGLIVGNMVFRKVLTRWGKYDTMKRVTLLLGFFPILIGLTPAPTLILLLAGVSNLVTAGFNLSHINTLLEVIPEETRSQYSAVYNTVISLGMFAAPLVSVTLANVFGLPWTLIGCGIVTLAGSSLFWFSPVKAKTPQLIKPSLTSNSAL